MDDERSTTSRIAVMVGGFLLAGAGALLLHTGLGLAASGALPFAKSLAQKLEKK